MKKVTRFIGAICMMALLTFVSTSCKKDQDTAGMDAFTAEVETLGVDGERAYINPDNFKFYWNEEDFVRVFNLATKADESTTSVFYKYTPGCTQTAHFRGPSVGPKNDLGYRLFYPVKMIKYNEEEEPLMAELENGNRVTFTVATKQDFNTYTETGHISSVVDPDAMPLAIDPAKLNGPATLKQMFGVAAISFKAATGTDVIVDSVKLVDKTLAITGDVKLKLDRVAITGTDHNLLDVWAPFEAGGWNEAFVAALTEELDWLDWCPSNQGYSIMMNCCYAKEEGALPTGVKLANTGGNNYTDFNFMLRPCALYNGFTVTLYVHDGEPLVYDTDNGDLFYGSDNTPDYTWGIKRAKIKNFRYPTAVNAED